MEMVLFRDVLDENFTLGRLFIDNQQFCYTCEDAVRNEKIYGETAIPKGVYKVIIDYSEHFKRYLPHILDVPGFEGIRIHGGNTAADTKGCILVGMEGTDVGVSNCKPAMTQLMLLLTEATDNGGSAEIKIV